MARIAPCNAGARHWICDPARTDDAVMTTWPESVIRLPDWVAACVAEAEPVAATDEARMGLAIRLSRLNVEHETGGPFAALVFERGTGRVIAPGVNLVEACANSTAHAELVALALAQRVLGTHALRGAGGGAYTLVTSTEPCAMCLGAVPWSGVTRLVCGARDADARAIGMDEGHKPADWIAGLEQRGIAVRRDVRRAEAAAVLQLYRERGGALY
jgi:tRNA(Arg) A34 adenosine deaminase TadA